MHQDERGHALTTSSSTASEEIDLAIHNFLHWKSDVVPRVGASLAADPDFAFAHVVGGLIMHGARNVHFRGKIEDSLTKAKKSADGLTEREQNYLRALEASASGQITEAVSLYETILAKNPVDLFAQRLAQMELFWIGEMDWSEQISRRASTHWDKSVPSYGVHLSCRSFDLEETHNFAEAEALGRKSVEIDPTDVWGTHSVAHVLIMQGRHEEGIAWIDDLKNNWEDSNQMQLHLWWHRCLFHLERGEFDEVLDIHDTWVRNREHPLLVSMPDLYIDMQNGASMLLRLELRGVDVGGRWAELEELTLKRLDDHTSPFTSPHFAVILAATGRFAEAERLLASMTEFANHDRGTFGPRYLMAAIPATQAVIAHRRGEHSKVVDLLLPARHQLWQMGGSHAQRDLFFLILADSILKEGRSDLIGIVLDDIERAGFSDAASRIGYRGAGSAMH
ncbi:MAG: tetratricopeptide repeat protein [Alphaproteobacteria bacterium]|nr:tetratricopeptide repeat protein [Alphaproteobacteria bacterium]